MDVFLGTKHTFGSYLQLFRVVSYALEEEVLANSLIRHRVARIERIGWTVQERTRRREADVRDIAVQRNLIPIMLDMLCHHFLWYSASQSTRRSTFSRQFVSLSLH